MKVAVRLELKRAAGGHLLWRGTLAGQPREEGLVSLDSNMAFHVRHVCIERDVVSCRLDGIVDEADEAGLLKQGWFRS